MFAFTTTLVTVVIGNKTVTQSGYYYVVLQTRNDIEKAAGRMHAGGLDV